MTCVSERSGSASSAMWLTDQAPAKIAALVSASTMKRLRAEKEMILSIIVLLSVLVLRLRASRRLGGRERRMRRLYCRGRAAGRRRRESGEGSLEPRFRIDQEIRLGDDIVSRRDPFPNLVVPVHLRARLDRARLEAALALRDENDRSRARRENRAVGHRQDAAERLLERHRRVHLRFQRPVPVLKLDPHPGR